LTGFTHNIWFLGVAMTLLALGAGFTNPAVNGSVSLSASRERQGEAMGVVQSLAALARIVGSPCGGFLYAHFTLATPFALSAGCAFIPAFFIARRFAALPVSAKKATRSTQVRQPMAVNGIGLFPLQNIVRSEVPYLLFDIRRTSDIPDVLLP